MSEGVEIGVEGEATMVALGQTLGRACREGAIIFLQGDLGAGKTTFARGFMHGLGYSGPVKSPTFTLVEHYVVDHRRVYHFDLYRLSSPEELEFMGIRDFFHHGSICLVEWPERGVGYLPGPDLRLTIHYVTAGVRRIHAETPTALGRSLLANLSSASGPHSA